MASLAVRLYRRGYGRSQVMAPSGPVIAFPGAEGFGSDQRHAYDGSATPTVYKVTNRNDSGAGSFRAAVMATDPRIVVFEVGGWIDLSSDIEIQSPYCYVAGQTAPSPGIGLRGGGLWVSGYSGHSANGHHVVIRHLTVTPATRQISASSIEYTNWVLWDHCSFFWHADEGMQFYGNPTIHDGTYSHCLISEGLDLGRPSGASPNDGSGGLVAAGTTGASRMTRASFIKNLYAHLPRRPGVWVTQQSETAFINNLTYNSKEQQFQWFGGVAANGPPATAYTALIGQVYCGGANTPATAYGVVWTNDESHLITGSQAYVLDALVDAYGANTMTTWRNDAGYDPLVGSIPSSLADVLTYTTVLAASEVEAYVSANAGSRPVERHSHDSRIVSELAGRTGSIKTASTWGEGSPGTFPTLANTSASFTTVSNPHTTGASGYTLLEEQIETYTALVQ